MTNDATLVTTLHVVDQPYVAVDDRDFSPKQSDAKVANQYFPRATCQTSNIFLRKLNDVDTQHVQERRSDPL